jgi:CPA2 family monovalent cation:H+ antiporter-2
MELFGSAEAFTAVAGLFKADGDGGSGAQPAPQAASRRHVDTPGTIELRPSRDAGCAHVADLGPVRPSARGCEDCLRTGDRWVHLRICMTCGHVGCCDSSKNRHATAHHQATGHPIVRSLEPGERWGWCYVDRVMLE